MATPSREKALSHFRRRSARYDRSSRWVVDRRMLDRIFALAGVRRGDVVLDLATGTGLVAERFQGAAREVVGLDISADMTRRAAGRVDRLLIGPVEKVPLPDASVDVCVCRQGLQFADLPRALGEVARVLRPGGRAVLCHLAAYGEGDRDDAFKIQALRNPARANFFRPGDLEAALAAAGLRVEKTERYRSRESVERWIDHGALSARRRQMIRDAYRAASPAFKRLHRIAARGGDVLDTMLFLIIRAKKPR